MMSLLKLFDEVLRYRYQALVLSGAIILLCVMGVVYKGGLQYGIDFTGGLRILLEFDDSLSPDEMSRVRSIFSGNFSSAQVQTVSLKGEKKRRGLMVTVRAHRLVNRLTDHLYQSGRRGSDTPFSILEELSGTQILNRDILKSNFTMGSSNDRKIDLTQASRERVQDRVQSLVNRHLSRRVISALRTKFVQDQGSIDINRANQDEIQSWLTHQQTRALVDRLIKLRSAGELSPRTLRESLKQFNVPVDEFMRIFQLEGDDPERLNLREYPRQNLRETLYQEFFKGKYSGRAEKIIEARKGRGLFRSLESVMELPALKGFNYSTLRESAYVSPFVIKRREMISPSIGAGLIVDAALAILLSLVGILLYLYVRFKITYSVGAIGAILHDVIVTVGLLTLFGVEFTVPVVAAILTVIGYSLNDTIVNFDRVRENRKLMGHQADWYDVINRSVREILSRTFVTSITTFIAALVLYLYGGIALQGFSITLLIGIISGTFSSIYVANVLLYELQRRFALR